MIDYTFSIERVPCIDTSNKVDEPIQNDRTLARADRHRILELDVGRRSVYLDCYGGPLFLTIAPGGQT